MTVGHLVVFSCERESQNSVVAIYFEVKVGLPRFPPVRVLKEYRTVLMVPAFRTGYVGVQRSVICEHPRNIILIGNLLFPLRSLP